jgi:hypothetical protein
MIYSPMAKKQTKSVSDNSNIKTWQSLSSHKKSIPIQFNNETLFTIEELTAEQFETFMQMIKPEKQNSIEDVNSLLNQTSNLAQMLKLMVKGVSFEGQSDDQILSTMNGFSTSINFQVNDALQELLIDNMVKQLHNMSSTIDTFQAVDKVDQKIQKLNPVTDAIGEADAIVTVDRKGITVNGNRVK